MKTINTESCKTELCKQILPKLYNTQQVYFIDKTEKT